ncbi:MAG TPA: orotidine-5'-phosphate decarboxylase [Steroidobacteraceae bacterium]|jgi:orotidine-5'-phosphate decarboxylase|nr:orotidine-5'-phosphate decarboxylase [Steroidobacteraceae bacterium]
MTFAEKLTASTLSHNSLLCVGLDPPQELVDRLGFADYAQFNRAIIEATGDHVCAYKPQFAHYASVGREKDLEATIAAIRRHLPDIPVILDAKRGDIGNTAIQYAREVFERYQVDAATVNPYMGLDTLEPFVRYADRGVLVLVKTSNPGSKDFQELELASGEPLYMAVAEAVARLGPNVGFVIGATYPEQLCALRARFPDTVFLVPGVGAQRADVAQVVSAGIDRDGKGIVINASRAILLADEGTSGRQAYLAAVERAARALRDEINVFRRRGAIATNPSLT